MKRYALCIGINDYGEEHSLQGAAPDAELVYKTLKGKFDAIELLTDEKATVQVIKDKVKRLVSTLSWGDILVFFFSGHGCDMDGVQALAIPDRDEEGCYCGNSILALDDIEELTNVPGVQRVFVLDCCRVCDRSLFRLFKRFVSQLIGEERVPAETFSCVKPILLASCARGQCSADDIHAKQGHFTRAFVKALKSREVRSFNKFRQKLDDYMGDYLLPFQQTPFIEGCVGVDVQLLPSWRKKRNGASCGVALTDKRGQIHSAVDCMGKERKYAKMARIARVKMVRDMTHASLALCGRAVDAAGASLESALRYIGDEIGRNYNALSKRRSPYGTLSMACDSKGRRLVGVCMRCETDLCAHSSEFVDSCEQLAHKVLTSGVSEEEVNQHCIDLFRVVGERVSVSEFARFERANVGCLGGYLHMRKILAMVELRCSKSVNARKVAIRDAAHAIAVHIAAKAPRYVLPTEIPQEEIDEHIEILLRQLKKIRGKLPPRSALTNIKKGMAAKYASEVCLWCQPLLQNEKMTVEDYLRKIGRKVKDSITIGQFKRLSLND